MNEDERVNPVYFLWNAYAHQVKNQSTGSTVRRKTMLINRCCHSILICRDEHERIKKHSDAEGHHLKAYVKL